jgi:2-(S-pantetheinyl)-carbapenam-3-carboxylate methyltransferase
MKQNVYITNFDIAPFLPYIYGALRIYAAGDQALLDEYKFCDPIFHRSRPEAAVDSLQQPAVLGLSCYVWNFRKNMKIARLCKERFPEALIVAGGPHVPDQAEDFLFRHRYVDIAVHGEGELAFQGILRERLSPHPDWSAVPGISFIHDGKLMTTQYSRIDLQKLQDSPYLAGYLDPAIEFFRSQGIPFFAPWETNRGCPYSCSFCDWGSATMSKVRRFDIDRLLAEIDFFGRMQIPIVHINDANFGLLTRDIEIAEALVRSREKYGFPREVRLNYAKNSNNRVFEISRMWHESGLLAETTLSMQATTQEVLEAISRKNIPVEQYSQLQQRYTRAGIRTYTEIILGLPAETKESFKRGLDYVLETGNHDDIRIYELAVLPNAPMANQKVRKAYGLEIINKNLIPTFPGAPPIPEDEIEQIPTVIATSSMSRQDWINCSVYARMLQFLHAQYFTRYVAIHLRRHYGVLYHRFYGQLQEYFTDRADDTVLGRVLAAFYDLYARFQLGPEIPHIDGTAGPCPRAVAAFIRHRPWISPTDWAWLSLTLTQDKFFADLRNFLPKLGCLFGVELEDVLKFQQEMLLRPDYDGQLGKICTYTYDLPGYFTGLGKLIPRETKIHFRDSHLGPRRMPLTKNDPAKFVNAVLATDWTGHGHYQHQLGSALITYGDSQTTSTASDRHSLGGSLPQRPVPGPIVTPH